MPHQYENLKGEIKKTVEKAINNNCWFYCIHSKNWLTPQEFRDICEAELIVGTEANFRMLIDYHMADPREGIRARMALVKKASVELQDFTEKVLTYYNFTEKIKR